MNNFCGAADPSIDKAVKLLQQYDVVSYNKFKNAQKETAQQPRSENSVKERNIKFRLTRKLHREGKLSTEVYAQEILEIYKFVPKKKYVEDLADTEESDDTEIEDSSDDDENDNESDICGALPEASVSLPVSRVQCSHCTKFFMPNGLERHQHYCLKNSL